jgi:hypothetical protein
LAKIKIIKLHTWEEAVQRGSKAGLMVAGMFLVMAGAAKMGAFALLLDQFALSGSQAETRAILRSRQQELAIGRISDFKNSHLDEDNKKVFRINLTHTYNWRPQIVSRMAK